MQPVHRQLYDLSEVLEGLAARLAAANIADGRNADLLRSAVAGQAATRPGTVNRQIDAGADFHAVILRIADSPRLTEQCTNLHILTFSFQLRHAQLTGSHPWGDHLLSEHREVADVILSGDTERAEQVMREHRRLGKQRLLNLPDSAFA